MTRATAITVWEVGLPRLSALHAVSRIDDHENRHQLVQKIKGALIDMSVHSAVHAARTGCASRLFRSDERRDSHTGVA